MGMKHGVASFRHSSNYASGGTEVDKMDIEKERDGYVNMTNDRSMLE